MHLFVNGSFIDMHFHFMTALSKIVASNNMVDIEMLLWTIQLQLCQHYPTAAEFFLDNDKELWI